MVSPIAEIADSTWRLRGELGGRNVFQYLLATPGREEALLIDTGIASTPREIVMPALRELGIAPEALRYTVVTHSDLDHQGGLAGIKESCGNAIAACGFADRPMVGDPEKLIADRYQPYLREHDIGYGDEEQTWMRANYGAPVEIEVTFSGGEVVDLGERRLQVLHAPGHSAGHLVLLEPDAGRLFSSDAIHWTACPGIDGGPALCPTYEEVDDYLGTIDMLEALSPSEVHSGHWPEKRDAEVGAFLAESREFVELVDQVILDRLAEPATLEELCEAVNFDAGPWESDPGMLRYCVHGHLRRLIRRGAVGENDPTRVPRRFRLSSTAPESAPEGSEMSFVDR